ncbi:MAG: cation diffusion facilitator family transporter [Candidatus Sericytochromatia bacterium]|nr:cation diffusion facilitator family transporter [Candidatus Sericytochromatia bacterium]
MRGKMAEVLPQSNEGSNSAVWDPRRIAMAASIAAAGIMLVGKLGAWWLTGSAAIFSDAIESVIHLVATGVATFGLWWTTQPADEDHPYGHGKFAYFSAGFEGALILVAALSIIATGVRALIVGPALQELGLGLLITAALALLNLFLGLYLVQAGKRHQSLVLVANGQHVLTDSWTSAGVVVGVGLVWLTGVLWLDPLVAIAVGLNIVWTAWRLLKASFEGLMDRTHPDESNRLDACLRQAQAEGLIVGYHQVRHRRVGHEVLIEAHLLFQDEASLQAAHRVAGVVERRIGALFPGENVTVTTHLEPACHDDEHPESHADYGPPTVDSLA